jgi:regulator of sigma D
MDFRQKNVLLLSQDIPFSDMISDAKATQKKAKSTYNQTWTTLSENTEINEFLYRFSETPMEIDQCADVEQI